MVLFLIIGIAGAALFVTSLSATALKNKQDRATADALASVKEALIGWSAARTPTGSLPNARPGELPCPDNNAPGSSGYGYEDGSCVAGTIGRVPWKTLGIPEPKDSSGETLWYTVAGSFRNYNMSSAPITSDTLGNLTVYADSTATTITTKAIAIIFSPGAALGSQQRSSTNAVCSTTGTTIAQNLCAANYLETLSTVNNAHTNGPFIQATQPSDTFNDRLLVMTNADLMPAVEQRVAREMISILQNYKAAIATSPTYILLDGGGVYPWADLADGNSNGSVGAAYNRARFPCGTALPVNWGDTPLLGTTATPTLPNWLTNGCASLTGWNGVIYYAVSRNDLDLHVLTYPINLSCTTCTASQLTVTNSNNQPADLCSNIAPYSCTPTMLSGTYHPSMLLITPGAATGSRASGWPASFSTITGYFFDSENADNNDDTYVVPSATSYLSSSYNRNRIYLVQ